MASPRCTGRAFTTMSTVPEEMYIGADVPDR